MFRKALAATSPSQLPSKEGDKEDRIILQDFEHEHQMMAVVPEEEMIVSEPTITDRTMTAGGR